MLGLTGSNEVRDDVLDWVGVHDPRYITGFFKDGQLHAVIKPPVVPHAALVNPKGIIVWEGHPKELTEATIEKALVGASPHLRFGWSAEFDDVAKALSGDYFASALKLAAAVKGPAAEQVALDVQGMLDARIERMRGAAAQPDVETCDPLTAFDIARSLDGRLLDLPERSVVEDVMTLLLSDMKMNEVLRAQRQLRTLREEASVTGAAAPTKNELMEIELRVMALGTEFSNTIVARQSDQLFRSLRG